MTLDTVYWAVFIDDDVIYIDGMPMVAPTREHAEIILEEIAELGYSEEDMEIRAVKMVAVSKEDEKIAAKGVFLGPKGKVSKDLN